MHKHSYRWLMGSSLLLALAIVDIIWVISAHTVFSFIYLVLLLGGSYLCYKKGYHKPDGQR